MVARISTGKSIRVSEPVADSILLKIEHQLVKVDFSDILYIEGLKDYAKIYLKNSEKPLLTLVSLKRLLGKLPESVFMRLHRSYIISIPAIQTATKSSVSVGSKTIYVSEQYKDSFNDFLNRWMI